MRGASIHVVLVEPEIHWNVGNAGRTCLAAGAQLHLVKPLGFSLEAREIRRAGLDYWPRVKPQVWPSWACLEPLLPKLGEPFFLSPEAPTDIWSVSFKAPLALVFGRESVGFSEHVRHQYRRHLVRIPQRDPALRSLNLSTCVGIALFEALRQLRL